MPNSMTVATVTDAEPDFGNRIPVKRKREERIVVRELPVPGLSRRMACITEKPCADQLCEPKPGTHLVS